MNAVITATEVKGLALREASVVTDDGLAAGGIVSRLRGVRAPTPW